MRDLQKSLDAFRKVLKENPELVVKAIEEVNAMYSKTHLNQPPLPGWFYYIYLYLL